MEAFPAPTQVTRLPSAIRACPAHRSAHAMSTLGDFRRPLRLRPPARPRHHFPMRFFNTSRPIVAGDHPDAGVSGVPPRPPAALGGAFLVPGDGTIVAASGVPAAGSELGRADRAGVWGAEAAHGSGGDLVGWRAERGHLVVFDRRAGEPWSERAFRREEAHEGCAITVWGM